MDEQQPQNPPEQQPQSPPEQSPQPQPEQPGEQKPKKSSGLLTWGIILIVVVIGLIIWYVVK